MPLPKKYRFKFFNGTDQSIASAADVTIKGLRWKFNSDGSIQYESSQASLYSNGGALTAGVYNASSAIDNSSTLWIGGDFTLSVNVPGSVTSGDMVLFLERSTDGGTTWDSNGYGVIVATISGLVPGVEVATFSI